MFFFFYFHNIWGRGHNNTILLRAPIWPAAALRKAIAYTSWSILRSPSKAVIPAGLRIMEILLPQYVSVYVLWVWACMTVVSALQSGHNLYTLTAHTKRALIGHFTCQWAVLGQNKLQWVLGLSKVWLWSCDCVGVFQFIVSTPTINLK